MRQVKRIFAIMLTILIPFSILVGCGDGKVTEATEYVKIGTWKTPQTIQPFLYEDFIADGTESEVLPFTNPGDMKAALLAGSLDMCGTTIVTAITAASKGEPILLVAGLSNKCTALVVDKNSDIETGIDLKEKRIAYVPGTMHHLLLLEVLANSGLDPKKDVELIRIDFFDMGQALAQGTIDAFYSGEPYPSMAVAEGFGEILLYPDDNEGFGIINSAMMTTREKVKEHPGIIKKLIFSHIEATEYLNSNKRKWIEKSLEFGGDREVLEIAMDNIQLFWDIDEEYLQSVWNLAFRMHELGLITEIPDIEAMFDLSFIEDYKRKAT